MVKYFFTPQALRQIKRLSREIQKRIIRKVEYFCQKEPLRYADFLTDSRIGNYRFRIGDYRVVFDKEKEKIIILAIGHRREIYKQR